MLIRISVNSTDASFFGSPVFLHTYLNAGLVSAEIANAARNGNSGENRYLKKTNAAAMIRNA